jgi:flagellar biosynthetic protein FliQ
MVLFNFFCYFRKNKTKRDLMTPEQVTDMGRLTIETLLLISAPLMLVALIVGLIIALFQALTSIQEMTLTFVPKILLVFMFMIMVMPWMGDVLNSYALEIFNMMATRGQTR